MIFAEGDPKNKKYPFMAAYTSFLKKMERPLIGREHEMKQLMAAMERPELCNAILLADAGTGKALADDMLIPVADERGYVPISEIKEGDMVFGRDGKPVKVLGVYPQGEISAYEVFFTDGSSIVCNDEHIWSVRKYDADPYVYENKTLREMLDYGITAPNDDTGYVEKCWCLPVCSPLERTDVSYKIHPYAMGAIVGAGCTVSGKYLGLSAQDDRIVRRVARLLDVSGFHRQLYTYIWMFDDEHGTWSENTEQDEPYRIQVQDILNCGDYSCALVDGQDQRHIPREYFLGSISQRFALLQGLMDSDISGLNTDRLCGSYFTMSFSLVEDVIELANSLGIRATWSRVSGVDSNNGYLVNFFVSPDQQKEHFSRVLNVSSDEDDLTEFHCYEIAIDHVENLYKKVSMTCIYVDSPEHLYIAGKNHVVTHNTALVQGTMIKDKRRAYLEVDLPRMIADLKNENEMADKLKQLFREVSEFRQEQGKEIVLFIDEFHQIVQLSPAAVEVLKPLLADSGTRGIRVIAATTYKEFQDYISSNQPLVERLQRINILEPNRETVVSILRGMAEKYGVANHFRTDAMFEAIYEYTNRYIPANAQPRKSILMMDSMIGWHRLTGQSIDIKLLADVIYETEGINIAFRVDANKIKEDLDKNVIAQEFATSSIANRLHICCADLNNKERPMSSFLFTGSTGVGKGLLDDEMIPVYKDDCYTYEKRNGDLVEGDMVFNREGKPVKVTGVYHRGFQDIYEVVLTDGRRIQTDSSHLWTYVMSDRPDVTATYTNSTRELFERGYNIVPHDGVKDIMYWIPVNGAIQYPHVFLLVDPYAMGAFVGSGCSVDDVMSAAFMDDCLVDEVNKRLGYDIRVSSFIDHPEIWYPVKDGVIPDDYMHGAVEQRWQFVMGLFDFAGDVVFSDEGQYEVTYSTLSRPLFNQVRHLLQSLGVSCSVKVRHEFSDDGFYAERYVLTVLVLNDDKVSFFKLPDKQAEAKKAYGCADSMQRKKDVKWVGIADIIKINVQKKTTCIMVDDEEHLYQTGEYIVTHNTETCKQLARILFENERSLIRMDMTEYALEESLERFRRELTTNVWEHPYSIILLDEIEKACAPVTRVLLQVLDDGRLLDRNNREVTFKNAYIIVTTNAGSEIYKTIAQYSVDDTGSGKLMERYETLIRESIKGTTGGNRFPPELLGRIDCIVPFQPLSEKTMTRICMMKLAKLAQEIKKKHHLDVSYDNKLFRYIVQDKMTTDSDAGGARGVVSRIEREVTTEIAKFINSHPTYRDGRTIFVQVEGDLMIDNKRQLESNAYVVVSDKPSLTFEK